MSKMNIGILSVLCFLICGNLSTANSQDEIRPYSNNPYYWQYKGEPVMLVGGSKDDNLFQVDNLEEHLDLVQQVGGNYIRNTMSSRDEGNARAFKRLPNGKYDLDQWNAEYWEKFEQLIKETDKRDIIVQIEFWDQHDYNGGRWDRNPWNPDQNINYTVSNTQLKGDGHYAEVKASGGEMMDFFQTVPELQNDRKVLRYQKKFVDKVLSCTFRYDHVLYTITNEFFKQHSPKWSWYWAEYIHDKAAEAGVNAQVTEMFQAVDMDNEDHKVTLDHPETFTYVDMSQNSTKMNDRHWNNLQWVRDYLENQNTIRPVNHTKTYGGDEVGWTNGDEHGIERFWRNIIGGAASVRFHRPPYGIGLNERAQNQIRSARMLLNEINIFNCRPDAEHRLLFRRDPDEAYLTYNPGRTYALYFPEGGSVELDLSEASGNFRIRWLNIEKCKWTKESNLQAEKKVTLDIPEQDKNWAAVIIKQ
jgi:sulfur relay (sulfurtransferase) DsrC/TusE family protein